MEQISSANFLPEHHLDADRERLMADLSDIVDQMILTFQVEYRDVFSKYRSFFSDVSAGFDTWTNADLVAKLQDVDKGVYLSKNAVNAEALVQAITEFGYDYIYDILINYRYDDENKYTYIEQAKALLNVLHLLKGHKVGLLLVTSLLGIEAHTQEWWERVDEVAQLLITASPSMSWGDAREAASLTLASEGVPADPDTYRLVITRNIPTAELTEALKDFSRKYVYPLVEIVIDQWALFDDPIVWTGAMGCCMARFTSADKRVTEEVFVNIGMMGCCIARASNA